MRGLRFQPEPVECPACSRRVRITLDRPHDPPRLVHRKHEGVHCRGSWKTLEEAVKDAAMMLAIRLYREKNGG